MELIPTDAPRRLWTAALLAACALLHAPYAAHALGDTGPSGADATAETASGDASLEKGVDTTRTSASNDEKDAASRRGPAPLGRGGARPSQRTGDSFGTPEDAIGEPPDTGSELGSLLLQTLLVLVAVCLLAYIVLRWGVGRLFGARRSGDRAIEILARQPLGSNKSILVVRIGPRTLIVGETESGMTQLGELDEDEADALIPDEQEGHDETKPFSTFLDWRGDTE